MSPLSIRRAQTLSATQTIRPSQKHFMFCSSFANKHSQNDTVGKTTINHEYAHFYFAIDQKTTAKTKEAAKLNKISAHINNVHQRYTSSYVAPTYPFLQIVIVCISAPPVPFWSCSHHENTTSFSDLQILFDLNMKNTSNLPGEKGSTCTIQNES